MRACFGRRPVPGEMDGNRPAAYQRVRQASDAPPLQPSSKRNLAGKNLGLSETGESVKTSEASRHYQSVRTSWDPWFLSWTVLAGFILLFLLMIMSLEVLAWYSRTHHGLATSDSRKHYLWTYGPTAGMKNRLLEAVMLTRTSTRGSDRPLAASGLSC